MISSAFSTIDEIRYRNIWRLMDERDLTIKDISHLTGKPPQAISAIMGKLTVANRPFSNSMARMLEEVLSLPLGWLDQSSHEKTLDEHLSYDDPAEIIVRSWPFKFIELGDVPAFAKKNTSSTRFLVRMLGDSMSNPKYPEKSVQHDAFLLVDMSLKVTHKDLVIACAAEGVLPQCRELHIEAPDELYLMAHNPNYPQTMKEIQEGGKIYGVVTQVIHAQKLR